MKEVLRVYWFLLFLFLVTSLAQGQVRRDSASRIRFGTALPATCNPSIGSVFFLITPGSPLGMHQCLATDSYTPMVGSMSGAGSDNQVAVFTGPSDIEGTSAFTFDSSTGLLGLVNDAASVQMGAAADAQMHRDAADIRAQRRGLNPQEWRLYDRFVSLADFDRLAVYIGGGPPLKTIEFNAETSNASQGINIDIEALPGGSSDGRITLITGTTQLVVAPSATSVNKVFNVSTAGTSSMTVNGFISSLGFGHASGIAINIDTFGSLQDSHSINMIGSGELGNRATWKTFVDVINVGGDSIWILQDDKNGGGFVTDFSITDDGGFNFPLPLPSHAIGGAIDLSSQLTLQGGYFSLVSGGTVASRFKLTGQITAATGQTVAGYHAWFGGNIRTQTAAESVTTIATVNIDEPQITDNLTGAGDILQAATLRLANEPTEGNDNFALLVSSGQVMFTGVHTSVGSNNVGLAHQVETALTGSAGNTSSLFTMSIGRKNLGAFITTQTATESISDIAAFNVEAPNIVDNLTGTIGEASTVRINGAPTEGTANFALNVRSGLTRLGGDVDITGNIAIAGVGPHSIAGVTFGAVQLLIGSTFTSDGASTIAAGLFHTPAIVGAPGDTDALTGVTFTAGITTQTATESIADIAQLQINEPNITDNLTGSITQASTVLITGAPTEGTRNYALNVEDGSVRFASTGPHVIGGVPQNFVGFTTVGNFTSGGVSIQAYGVRHAMNLLGAAGDTLRLAGMDLAGTITTQTATESITDVAQLSVTEPVITDNLTGTITNASTVLILGAPTEGTNNFALNVRSGQSNFGGDIVMATGVDLLWETDGNGNIGETDSTLRPGTIRAATDFAVGPTPSLNGAIRITNGAGIRWRNGANNNNVFAISVDGSDIMQLGEFNMSGLEITPNIGFYGTTPVAQAAAYTRNATIVEDRTLLASASATALNNNNVLAALIADLQAYGLLQ